MIKTLGALLIIGASTLLGFIYAETIRKRLSQLKELRSSLIQLQNEIFYTRTALPDACLQVSHKGKYPVNSFFQRVSTELSNNNTESVYAAFEAALSEETDQFNITKEDKDILLNLAKALGDSDLDGHKKMFNLTDHNLQNKIESLEANADKTVKMYRYLGFSLGTAVAIILI